ncbi:MAG: hypothetical protein KDA42_02075 [Planctomycetales bacterium]|nr:hypothetical protein [Planctomycetales bacterium]
MISLHAFALLADVEGWVRAAVFLVFIIFWVLSQVFGNKQKSAPPRRAQRERPHSPDSDPPAGEDRIRAELQEFLRDAAERRQQTARPRGRQREKVLEAEIVEPEVVEAVTITQSAKRAEPAASRSQDQQPDPYAIANEKARTSHLGEEVALADEKVESHLHEVFDHEVSHLHEHTHEGQASGRGERRGSRSKPSLAREIREMMREPRSVRRAVVLNEVLRRPEDRW